MEEQEQDYSYVPDYLKKWIQEIGKSLDEIEHFSANRDVYEEGVVNGYKRFVPSPVTHFVVQFKGDKQNYVYTHTEKEEKL